jgi:hypothetical protein
LRRKNIEAFGEAELGLGANEITLCQRNPFCKHRGIQDLMISLCVGG